MSPTIDDDFVQGARFLREEYGPPNEVEAFRLFKRAAEQRHSAAAFHLGACYHAGMGVVRDDVKAIEWLRMAASLDPLPAYSESLGADIWQYLDQSVIEGWAPFPPSEPEVGRYRQLAEAGHIDAEAHLGVLYSHGFGVVRDPEQAVRWFRRAAEGGSKVAQWMLAMALGIPQSPERAYFWLTVAQRRGLPKEYENDARHLLHALRQDIAGVARRRSRSGIGDLATRRRGRLKIVSSLSAPAARGN